MCFTYAALFFLDQVLKGVGLTNEHCIQKHNSKGAFACNGKNNKPICVWPEWRCDGYFDCLRGEDEPEECNENSYCQGLFGKNASSCVNNDLKSKCIMSYVFCDGEFDCLRRKDEPKECNENSYCQGLFGNNAFSCVGKNNRRLCVRPHWRCDGEVHCLKGEDEKNCQRAIPPIEPTTTSTAFESTTTFEPPGNSWIIPAVVTVTVFALVSVAVIIVKCLGIWPFGIKQLVNNDGLELKLLSNPRS